MSDDHAHGASITRVVKHSADVVTAAVAEKQASNPQFEVVYVCVEEFADGCAALKLCWRIPDPNFVPAKGRKPEHVTYLTPLVWDTIERMRAEFP